MAIPLHRRLLYSLVTLLAFLALLEGVLALLPLVWTRAVQPEEAGVGQTILFVGDSVTLGEGLGFGRAWPEQLDDQLEARGLADIAVYNYAREGATGGRIDRRVEEHLLRLRHGGEDDGPGPVVLLMLGHNDFVWWVSRKRARGDIRSKLRDNTQRSSDVSATSPTLRLLRIVRWA